MYLNPCNNNIITSSKSFAKCDQCTPRLCPGTVTIFYYVNDLPNPPLASHILLYADVVAIFSSVPSVEPSNLNYEKGYGTSYQLEES